MLGFKMSTICILGLSDLCKRIFGGETSSHHGGDGSALKVRANVNNHYCISSFIDDLDALISLLLVINSMVRSED